MHTGEEHTEIGGVDVDQHADVVWIRLTWLVPLAVVFGAGSVLGRRLLIERGGLDAA
ncbi:MAG: hypothetical protein WD646_11925 [Actinomycetota bacterium]